MDYFITVIRNVGALCAGGLGAIIGFGLLLGLAWLPSQNATYKLVTGLLVAALALTLGGFITGMLVKQNKLIYGLAFGLLFGLVSFGYILGPDWRLSVAIPLSGVLGALGGWLAVR